MTAGVCRCIAVMATVEPLSSDQAWVRGQHPVRLTINLRPEDSVNLDLIMAGTGYRRAQFVKMLVQEGVAARMNSAASE